MKPTLSMLAEHGGGGIWRDMTFLPKPAEPYEQDACGRWLRARPDLADRLFVGQNWRAFPDKFLFEFGCQNILDSIEDEQPSTVTGSLPWPMQRHITREAWIHHPFIGLIVMSLPYTNFGYVTFEHGFITNAISIFNVWRLHDIRQLAFLGYPLALNADDHNEIAISERFPHNRFSHVLDVCAVATLIGQRVQLSKKELRTLRLAALTHDVLTPAGGDLMKTISETAFDEDARYAELLETDERKEFLVKHDIDGLRLAATVRGEDPLSLLLDMADKIAYVARDAEIFLRYCPPPATGFDEYERIRRLLDEHPDICAWWETIELKRGKIVVEEPERLFRFLVLRVLLFREMYYGSSMRYAPMIVVRTIAAYLIGSGRLGHDDFLAMTDKQLEDLVEKETCLPTLSWACKLKPTPSCESFATKEEALRRERELVTNGIPFVLVEDLLSRIQPSTGFPVRGPNGRIMRFDKARPAETELLNALATVEKPHRVYYLPKVEMNAKYFQDLLVFRRKQLGLD